MYRLRGVSSKNWRRQIGCKCSRKPRLQNIMSDSRTCHAVINHKLESKQTQLERWPNIIHGRAPPYLVKIHDPTYLDLCPGHHGAGGPPSSHSAHSPEGGHSRRDSGHADLCASAAAREDRQWGRASPRRCSGGYGDRRYVLTVVSPSPRRGGGGGGGLRTGRVRGSTLSQPGRRTAVRKSGRQTLAAQRHKEETSACS